MAFMSLNRIVFGKKRIPKFCPFFSFLLDLLPILMRGPIHMRDPKQHFWRQRKDQLKIFLGEKYSSTASTAFSRKI